MISFKETHILKYIKYIVYTIFCVHRQTWSSLFLTVYIKLLVDQKFKTVIEVSNKIVYMYKMYDDGEEEMSWKHRKHLELTDVSLPF